jgi:beta-1,4-N-acetylglucosaminyltransferase
MAHIYQDNDKPTKRCFVTIGATAPFDALLTSVLDQPFLEALNQYGYTHLLVQYGKEGRAIFEKFVQDHPVGSDGRYGLDISGFDFNKAGLEREMQSTKTNEKTGVSEGMILSHAGVISPVMEAISISPCC